MSHIFEALQRAESERSNLVTHTSMAATEVLERAELQARTQRSSESRIATIIETTLSAEDARQKVPETSSGGNSHTNCNEARTVPAEIETLRLSQPFHDRLVAFSDQSSPAAEAFRLLCVRLRDLRKERPFTTLLISSTNPQDGKSLIAANLACTLAAASRQNVLLLDGDVRRPSQAELFRLDSLPGLCEYFQGERNLKESIYRLDGVGIWLLPAGQTTRHSSELIQPAQLAAMAKQLGQWFDWIIIDSPPVLPLADTSVLEKMADRVLMVARRGVTSRRKLKRGLEAIDPNKLIGTILNSSTRSKDEDYYYYRRPSASEGAVQVKGSSILHLPE